MIAFGGRVVWIIAALGLFLLAPSVAKGADVNPCNGSDLLCGRTLDQVVLPGTHNSMSAAENNWALPNQTFSISNQLKLGVRSLLIDTYYGKSNGNGSIATVSRSEGEATHAQTFMCHADCFLGSVDLTAELGRIKDFMAANPREVLVIVNEDNITPDAFAEAVDSSGLLPYVYLGPTTSYPTLSQMIASNQRILMLSQGDPGTVPWYHDGYDGPMMETPYTFEQKFTDSQPVGPDGVQQLTDPTLLNESCRATNRGVEPSPLFLMNHWVTTGVTPDPAKADLVNTRPALVARARACDTRRGKLPTIVAVDFFGRGDVIGAVRELNGVPDPVIPPPPPPIEPKAILVVTKPKAVTVKAKRKANFRVTVFNTGDAAATRVKVCAAVPARLARRSRCATIASIPAGGSAVARLSAVTKKRYRRAAGLVRFSVYSSLPTLKTSTRLIVKPLKKPRKHRKRR